MILRALRWLFTPAPKPQPVTDVVPREPSTWFTSDLGAVEGHTREAVVLAANRRAISVTPANFRAEDGEVFAMDAQGGNSYATSAKAMFSMSGGNIPDAQLLWYASQGFIGFQTCAILAQQWLIDKACTVPARDAIRNGYRITVNDGQEIAPEVLDKLTKADRRYGVARQCVELVKMARVFGIRIMIFKVDSRDEKYYEQPFNPDGITPGSYRGMVQVDPYWCVPELSVAGASDPTSSEFYEPTYWTIQGKRYHKSHLVIVRGPEVSDLLKPSYMYAGLSIPQRIFERVYSAERTANEAPQLALTKRAMIFYTNTASALANQQSFAERLGTWASYRDNFGVKIADKEGDKIEQHDTALGDFDALVMTQYQLVAAIANVPATKLLGTTPKGFNSSGDYEQDSYHEELESIQTSDMEPAINRHHLCVIRSEIAPAAGIKPFSVSLEWEPTDTPGAKEEAEIRKLDAERDAALVQAGALDGADVRQRLATDPKSGYDGIDVADVPVPPAPIPAAPQMDALDSAEFDAVTGRYAEAYLITNQSYLSEEIVCAKLAAQDFTVQLSPEFVTPAGQRYRVVIDGHHSLAAATRAGVCPVFVEANYAESDYKNAVTQLPVFGQESAA